MAPRSRGMERILSAAISSPQRSTPSPQSICRSCRRAGAGAGAVSTGATWSRREYAVAAASSSSSAAAAAAEAEIPPPLQQQQQEAPVAAAPTCMVKAGILLSRPPLLTPDTHPFEAAYHLYQRRLNERLVLPFTQYLYYKRGTPTFEEWRQRRTARGGVAGRDLGVYNAYGKESWHDEVLVGDESGSDQRVLELLVDEEGRGAEFTPRGGNVKTGGLTRVTAADQRGDTRSLERRLSRTLYLLVKQQQQQQQQQQQKQQHAEGGDKGRKGKGWELPSGPLLPLHQGKEGLREAARRVLAETCGPNMNTWFVGAHPVGHWIRRTWSPTEAETLSESEKQARTEKTFFMKARIFAGQANVQQAANPAYQDFQWLTKEEIKAVVDPAYWSRIQDMLVAQ